MNRKIKLCWIGCLCVSVALPAYAIGGAATRKQEITSSLEVDLTKKLDQLITNMKDLTVHVRETHDKLETLKTQLNGVITCHSKFQFYNPNSPIKDSDNCVHFAIVQPDEHIGTASGVLSEGTIEEILQK